jgi:hypothetical protein
MSRVGRPSKASPPVVESVERALASGATVAMAAAAAGVSPRTVDSWIARGVVARRRLRSVPEPDREPVPGDGRFSDEVIEEAMVAAILKAAPVDWRAARFILQSRWPERWGGGPAT